MIEMKLIEFLNRKFAMSRKTEIKYSRIVKSLTEKEKENKNLELS